MFKKQFVWLLLSAMPAVPAVAEQLTLDEIVAKHVESLGGMDALKAVKSARMSAKFNMGGMELPVTMVFKRPSKLRVETEFQGMKVIQAYDGETGWAVVPMMGSTEPTKMADDQLKQMQEQSDFDGPLVDYAKKGHTVELLGKEDVEGTEAYKLEVIKQNGDVLQMYLDSEYFLVFKQEGRVNVQGQEVNATTHLSEYKEVGDILLAHSIEVTPEGAPSGIQITFSDVELNVEVDDAQFAFPEKATEETAEAKSEG
jgi:outer membrane lipoprotein-sorting protein